MMVNLTNTTLKKGDDMKNDAINLRGKPTATVALTDYRVISQTLAEVVVAMTGKPSKDALAVAVTKRFGEAVTPVLSSFRWLRENEVAVGFVSSVTSVRTLDGDSVLANYKMLASNMYMDQEDDSLWELKQGATGRYLARRTQEELPEILSAAKSPHRADIPTLSRVLRTPVKVNEFISFVSAANDVDYGVCVGSTKEGESVILSVSTKKLVAVDPQRVVRATAIDFNKMRSPRVTAGMQDAQAVIEYWKQAYQYDQAYVNKIIQQVEEMAAM